MNFAAVRRVLPLMAQRMAAARTTVRMTSSEATPADQLAKLRLYGKADRPEFHHRGARSAEDKQYDMAYWLMFVLLVSFGGYCARECWQDFAPKPEEVPERAWLRQEDVVRFK